MKIGDKVRFLSEVEKTLHWWKMPMGLIFRCLLENV